MHARHCRCRTTTYQVQQGPQRQLVDLPVLPHALNRSPAARHGELCYELQPQLVRALTQPAARVGGLRCREGFSQKAKASQIARVKKDSSIAGVQRVLLRLFESDLRT